MVIEVDCCRPKGRGEDWLIKSSLVPAGGCLGIDLLRGKARVAIINSANDSRGLVLVNGETKTVEVSVYEDGDDVKGRKVNPAEEIMLMKKQILLLRERGMEIRIYPATSR